MQKKSALLLMMVTSLFGPVALAAGGGESCREFCNRTNQLNPGRHADCMAACLYVNPGERGRRIGPLRLISTGGDEGLANLDGCREIESFSKIQEIDGAISQAKFDLQMASQAINKYSAVCGQYAANPNQGDMVLFAIQREQNDAMTKITTAGASVRAAVAGISPLERPVQTLQVNGCVSSLRNQRQSLESSVQQLSSGTPACGGLGATTSISPSGPVLPTTEIPRSGPAPVQRQPSAVSPAVLDSRPEFLPSPGVPSVDQQIEI